MSHRYFVIKVRRAETEAYVSDPPDEFDDTHLLVDAVPLADRWPGRVRLRFSKERPEGRQLTDALANVFSWIVASGRLAAALVDRARTDVELLPVEVLDHEGRLASAEHAIVNLLRQVAAIDRDRSRFDPHVLHEHRVSRFHEMVLREEVRASGPPLFRLAEDPYLILMRDDLAREVEARGLTGLLLVPTEEYTTVPRGTGRRARGRRG